MQTKLPWICALLLGVIGWLAGYTMNDPGAEAGGGRGERGGAAASRDVAKGLQPETGAGALATDFERAAAAALADEDPLRQAHRLYLMVEHLQGSEMTGALNAALRLDPEKRPVLINGLLARWAEIDPRASAEYAVSLSGDQFGWVRSKVLGAWGEKDFAAASAYALARPAGTDRDAAAGAVALGLAKTDPQAALQFIDANVASGPRGSAMGVRAELIRKWALQDFRAAGAYALTLKDVEERRNLLREIPNAAIDRNPREVLSWAEAIPDSQARYQIYWRAIGRWANQDPRGVLRVAASLPLDQQPMAISGAIGIIGERDAEEARRLIDELPAGMARDWATGALLTLWSQKDPGAAAEYAQQLPAGARRDDAVAMVAKNLLHTDAPAAIALVAALPTGSTRTTTLQDLAMQWAQSDPRAAADYLRPATVADELHRNELLVALRVWAESNVAEAFSWVEKMPAGPPKDKALATVIGQMASSDPNAALALALKQSGEAQATSAAAVVSSWMYQDPAAASAWVAELPEGDTRTKAARQVALAWVDSDPGASARWLESLPTGPSRDSAVGGFVSRTVNRDPVTAVTWAATIGDEQERLSTLETVAQQWLSADPAEARAWLAGTGLLPEELRARLLSNPPN